MEEGDSLAARDQMTNEASVFSKINVHMLEGMMLHDELYRAFLYLNLYQFAKKHKERYVDEAREYRKLNKYYITHRNNMIEEIAPDVHNRVILSDWYSKSRFDFGPDDICTYVSSAINTWVDWERQTKELYTEGYNKLIEYGFAAEADYVMKLVKAVDEELAEAEALQIELEAIKYDIIEIMRMNEEKE